MCSPDIAQALMESVLSRIYVADMYIDDVWSFSSQFNHHIKLLSTILHHLNDNSFTINPLKCEWAVQEFDWLGYLLIPYGLRPQKKNVANLHVDHPHTSSDLHQFISCVKYYHEMCPNQANVLKPLTNCLGMEKNQPLYWIDDEMQTVFTKMWLLLATDVLSAFSDHKKHFHIYMDLLDYQMSACIM
jgi:hypothetical protein